MTPRGLDRQVVIIEAAAWLKDREGVVAEIARELTARLGALTQRVNALERRIAELVRKLAPTLLALPGCASLSAAKLVAETADVNRFHSAAAFAIHNGTPPIPVWSGNTVRHRLNRGGNRQLNVALHRIAITQMRLGGAAADHVARRKSMGNTKTEAIRALRRRISDEVYRRLRMDHPSRLTAPVAVAA